MNAQALAPGGARPLRSARATTIVVALLWTVTVASAAGRWALVGPVRRLPEVSGSVLPTDIVSPLVAAMLAGLGALVVLRGDGRRYGWLLLAMGVTTGFLGVAAEYSVYAVLAETPADLPFTVTAGWLQDLWMIPWFLGFLLLPALFPDGTGAGPRWCRRVRMTAAAWVVLILVFVLAERPLTNAFLEVDQPPLNPTGVLPVPDMIINVAWLVVTTASIVVGIGSLVTRWRGADAELRQRLKWVMYAFVTLLGVLAADLANQAIEAGLGLDLGLGWPLAALLAVTMGGLPLALGFAVLKFRLYDVDLVINRTIVYAALTAVIVTAYVAVVVGIGALLPVEELFLSLVATGVVAVAFTPLRSWVQRRVNRVMFGQRDDPYAVLSELGRLVARSGAPEETLRTLAEAVATTLKLPGVSIELEQEGAWRTAATYGAVANDGDGALVVPLHHQGTVVGRLVVAPRSLREPLSAPDLRLLEDIAHQAGALAYTVRLTLALQRSREGLVQAREEERRRIRRDLHDGLGPSLASQTFRLDVVLERLQDDPATADLVATLKSQNQQLVADIRRLVYELRPPALDELGVDGALAAHAGQLDGTGRLSVVVETTPKPLPPLSAAVEVAAYRIAREAITNVVRHAAAARCMVSLVTEGSTLTVTVADDGIGLAAGTDPGLGLASMRERAEELGGALHVDAEPRRGTRVRAWLPITVTPPGHSNGSRAVHQVHEGDRDT